jgi:hypothetical protein
MLHDAVRPALCLPPGAGSGMLPGGPDLCRPDLCRSELRHPNLCGPELRRTSEGGGQLRPQNRRECQVIAVKV